jgi:hypothetical protein
VFPWHGRDSAKGLCPVAFGFGPINCNFCRVTGGLRLGSVLRGLWMFLAVNDNLRCGLIRMEGVPDAMGGHAEKLSGGVDRFLSRWRRHVCEYRVSSSGYRSHG